MTLFQDVVGVEESEMEEEEFESESDEHTERFHDIMLDYKATNALSRDVEENMDTY